MRDTSVSVAATCKKIIPVCRDVITVVGTCPMLYRLDSPVNSCTNTHARWQRGKIVRRAAILSDR